MYIIIIKEKQITIITTAKNKCEIIGIFEVLDLENYYFLLQTNIFAAAKSLTLEVL